MSPHGSGSGGVGQCGSEWVRVGQSGSEWVRVGQSGSGRRGHNTKPSLQKAEKRREKTIKYDKVR